MSGKLSRRGGAVDPFIVMDVMAAAAEKEAAGGTAIHLAVGQAHTPAPRSQRRRLRMWSLVGGSVLKPPPGTAPTRPGSW